MGVELLPSITSNEAQITLSTADGLTKEESYAIAGQVEEAALNVENVEEVGITTDTSMAGLDISQLATGLSVKVYGKDPETLTTVSEKVMELSLIHISRAGQGRGLRFGFGAHP